MAHSGPPTKKKRQDIASFFTAANPAAANTEPSSMQPPSSATVHHSPSIPASTASSSSTPATLLHGPDIALAFSEANGDWKADGTVQITDACKRDLLTSHVMPDASFKYPYGCKKTQKVYLSKLHITGKNDAFKYSFIMEGVVCVPCVLFGPTEVENDRGKITPLGNFVTKPFKKFEKISERIKDHLENRYHRWSQERADQFLRVAQTPGSSVVDQLDDVHKQQVMENRQRLVPILKTIILCGRLGIALRGHRDDGVIDPQSAIRGQEGNFRALLAFRVDSGDEVLKTHLSTASKKATYISKEVQNELIQLCGAEITNHIAKEVKNAKFFAIIADETTDSSHCEQLCLCIRFLSMNSCQVTVKEEFLGFIGMNDVSAQSIATEILTRIKELGLLIEDCIGQGYDGAAAMSGHISGVQTRIREEAPAAIYVHCASHCLNLVLNHSSNVVPVRNMFTTLSEVINFFNDSPKRREMLDINLLTFCDTRFIQRHDAILRFTDNFEAVFNALSDMSENANMDAKSKAKALSLSSAMSSPSFMVSLASAHKVMSLTVTLSKRLQSPKIDLSDGTGMVNDVNKTLQEWRRNDNAWLGGSYSVFEQANGFASIIGVQLTKPRLSGRQMHRASAVNSDESDSDYFKRSIWLPYLDAVIMHMTEKFSHASQTAFLLSSVLTGKKVNNDDFQKVYAMYGKVIGCHEQQLHTELSNYLSYRHSSKSSEEQEADDLTDGDTEVRVETACHGEASAEKYLNNSTETSQSLITALSTTPQRYPNVRKLLRIAVTMPLTSCSAERCFSAMKILKSRLRSTMVDERLNGLALMYIHKDNDISIESVISNFAMSSRKMPFVL